MVFKFYTHSSKTQVYSKKAGQAKTKNAPTIFEDQEGFLTSRLTRPLDAASRAS
jgi:hypothetical protein